MLKLVLILVSSMIAISESGKGAQGCFKKLDMTKALGDCMTSLNLNVNDTSPKYEDYQNPDFDDKCLGKCLLAGMELIMENGNLDKDAFFDMIDNFAPKPLVNKLTEAVTKCASSSGLEKVEKKDDCGPYGKFRGCFLTATDKLC